MLGVLTKDLGKNFFLLLSKCPNKMKLLISQVPKLLVNSLLSPKYPNSKISLKETEYTPKWQEYVPSFCSETGSSHSINHS